MIRRAGMNEARDLANMAIQMWTDHDLEDLTEEFRQLRRDLSRCFSSKEYNVLV